MQKNVWHLYALRAAALLAPLICIYVDWYIWGQKMDSSVKATMIFFSLCTLLLFATGWLAGGETNEARFTTLIFIILGALCGLLFGILSFPLPDEIKALEKLEKTAITLLTGYLFGKLDGLLKPMFESQKNGVFIVRVLLFSASFLIMLMTAFYARTGYFKDIGSNKTEPAKPVESVPQTAPLMLQSACVCKPTVAVASALPQKPGHVCAAMALPLMLERHDTGMQVQCESLCNALPACAPMPAQAAPK